MPAAACSRSTSARSPGGSPSSRRYLRLNLGEAATRLRFPAIAARPAGEAFGTVATATLQRKRLWIDYHARSTDAISERQLSPQRIVHYRES